MPAWASAAVISILGISTVTGLTFSPSAQTRRVAAFVPPWADAEVVSGATILDMRWQGHLMVLDTGADAAVMAGLRDRGFWLIDATGFQICGQRPEGT